MKQKVIAFVGMSGSGKDTCASYLSEKHGWPVIHFGRMVYEEVQRRGLDNVADEIFVREDMRKVDGPAVLAKHVAKKIHEYFGNKQNTVLLEGLYSWSEYKYLEEEFGSRLTVIAVVAPKAVRRRRVLERKDDYRSYTLDQLIKREVAEIENLEKGGPIAYADYTIANDSTLENMHTSLEKVLKTVDI